MTIPFQRTYAGPGDTIIVQTFTFGLPQNDKFVFPPDTVRFEKILMYYTLKCNPAQNPACGEWNYLTYTYLYDYTYDRRYSSKGCVKNRKYVERQLFP
ncbi:MAG: hypothetical protein ABII90_05285 [Bacteroidota bacterium]